MLIGSPLPQLAPAQPQSSGLSFQQSSENGGGEFSALLFLIFASPTTPAVAGAETAAEQAPTAGAEQSVVTADTAETQILPQQLLPTPLAETLSAVPLPVKETITEQKPLPVRKSPDDTTADDVVETIESPWVPYFISMPSAPAPSAGVTVTDAPESIQMDGANEVSPLASSPVMPQARQSRSAMPQAETVIEAAPSSARPNSDPEADVIAEQPARRQAPADAGSAPVGSAIAEPSNERAESESFPPRQSFAPILNGLESNQPMEQATFSAEKDFAQVIERAAPVELPQTMRPSEPQASVAPQSAVTPERVAAGQQVSPPPRTDDSSGRNPLDETETANKIADGKKPQPVRGAAMNPKNAELTYAKPADAARVAIAAHEIAPAAEKASATAQGAPIVTATTAAQSAAKPLEIEWTDDPAPAPSKATEPAVHPKITGDFSPGQDQTSAFEFDGRGERPAADAFKNNRAETAAQGVANFPAVSGSANETAAPSHAQSEAVWPPVIHHVAGEIAGHVRRNQHEAVIVLDPPELGKLKIDLLIDGDKVQVRIRAEANEARGLIENHMPDLKQALVSHHLDLVDARVDGGSWSGAGDLMQGFRQDPGARQEPAWSGGSSAQGGSETVEAEPATVGNETGRVSIRA